MKQIPIRVVSEGTASELAQEAAALQWLADSARTATERNFSEHMNLISRKVALFGVPGFEVIQYDEWASQCEHEFVTGTLSSVSYDDFKLIGSNGNRVMFKTIETVIAADGQKNENGIEVILEKEDDDVWRLIQERLLPPEEVKHDGLKKVN